MTETYDKGWLHVSIPVNDQVSPDTFMDRLFKLEREKLWDKGISFDTGFGFGYRDWELDWSLEGADPEDVIAVLDEAGITYEVGGVPDQILDDMDD